MASRLKTIVIDARSGGIGEPLVRALGRFLPDLSRAELRRLVEGGQIFLDGRRCRVASRSLAEGSRLVIHVPDPNDPSSAPGGGSEPLTILHEDEDVIAIDKRAGQHVNETETSARLALVEQLRDRDAYVVHRLDRETSGVLVFAKGKENARLLSEAFQARMVDKSYLAVLAGELQDGVIDLPIGPDPRRPRARAVQPRGKRAVTRLVTLGRVPGVSAVELHPETGRTHQLRVHVSHLGAPIVGDALYGGPLKVRIGTVELGAPRVLLHAFRLVVPLRGRTLALEAPIPADLGAVAAAGLPLQPVSK